ncbi:type I restriction endonuclease [Stenotrophomonas indicatrix]|uniref:type I restriction endonuclease n=1 Tax=Stenotrophomonas indicatrix TaxID=2045451 RepID=UPI0026525076|nr:type I restriction endonuclease [Stenotrophomonas indicatrix]MDN8645405.1 type I restriction endonuclease [Stenotrophomonas indicatrix]MDN8656703.1 type I restriction endonuclease [Stenotrophomonas indicatrix]
MPPQENVAQLENESDVEQKFIVQLLTNKSPDGLGYSTADFRTKADLRSFVIDKGQSKKKYFPDYVVILRGLPLLVIEAKAPGVDLEEALREAMLYAHQVNIQYPHTINPCQTVLATDGVRIIASKWDGGGRIDIEVAKLNSVDDGFSKLSALASKASLSKQAEQVAASVRKQANYVSPVQLMGGRQTAEATVGENSFGANVSIEYKHLFNPETREEKEKLVNNAYITSQRRLSHVAPIDRLIRKTLPLPSASARAIDDTGNPRELLTEISGRSRSGELCLLIGSVGSGKSTFTDYIKSKGLSPGAAARTDWAHVNLNVAPQSRDLIYPWLTGKITEEIRSINSSVDMDELAFQRKIYSQQLSKIEKGRASLFPRGSIEHSSIIASEIERLESDKDLTLKLTIEHLYKNTGRTLVVVLDNCDKRSRDTQLLMFEVASWLKDTMHCMVFLPLRDVTYDSYRNSPPLDTVIKDLVFRIDPPQLDKVIQARLDYAIRETKSRNGKFYYSMENGIGASCEYQEVGQYLATLVGAIFQNSRFKQIISGLAGRNIRKGIEIVLDICKSGHIPESEILKARAVTGPRTFPSQLIMQILLKGKRKYYSDSETYLKNIFHSVSSDQLPDPFVRLGVLRWLKSKQGVDGPSNVKGYHKILQLVADLQAHGFVESNILEALHDLLDSECCFCEAGSNKPELEDLVSLAPAGDIHLNMLSDTLYLAAIAEVTLFRENQAANEIKEIILGNRAYPASSRSGQILISEILTSYLSSYHTDFHLSSTEILNDDFNNDLIRINEIKGKIDYYAANDRNIATSRERKEKYPPGCEVSAVVSKLLPGACIANFDDRQQAYLRLTGADTATLNVGDAIRITLNEWHEVHQRFGASKANPS